MVDPVPYDLCVGFAGFYLGCSLSGFTGERRYTPVDVKGTRDRLKTNKRR